MTTYDDYGDLWGDVVQARKAVAESRVLLRGRPATVRAREDLLSALEAYIGCLESRGRPVPYQLQRELKLSRLTQGR